MDKVRRHSFVGLLCFLIAFSGCSNSKSTDEQPTQSKISFYKVGHRGTRGLMPENTIPAMKRGLDEGANTIEFDVHITKDHKVIVYHDASVNPQYTRLPDVEITEDNRKDYTFYQMNYADIESLQVGKNEAYSEQEDIITTVPLLSILLDSVESYTSRRDMKPPVYLLEIKSSASTDGDEQPAPEEYVRILMELLKPWRERLDDRLIIQSFDMRPLQEIHDKYPEVRLGYLIGNKELNLQQDVEELGFTPEFYNPYYKRVTPQLIEAVHAEGVKICPWTVNKPRDVQELRELGVDGVITDYPNDL